MRAHHRRLRTLDQQAAQVVVAAFGDAAQVVLAAARMLARHQADPGTERCAAPELLEVAHRRARRKFVRVSVAATRYQLRKVWEPCQPVS